MAFLESNLELANYIFEHRHLLHKSAYEEIVLNVVKQVRELRVNITDNQRYVLVKSFKSLRFKEKSCSSKKRFSKLRADIAIEQQAERGVVFYYYPCNFCEMYHLTKNEPIAWSA